MKTLKISSLIVLLAALFFSCQKEYSLEVIVTSAGTWQFNDDTKLYAGNIDTAYIETTGTTKTLNLIGKSADGQQNFLLHLYATDSFTVGTYKASLFQSDFQYYTQSKTIYQADQLIGEFIVTITAIGNNNITGIFAGASEDSTGAIKPLTLGKFTSGINLIGNGTGGGGTVTDYFPTTAGSYWAYGNGNTADSFLITATSQTKSINGLVYNVFTYDSIPASGSPAGLYYRKSSGLYYENFNTQVLFGFDSTGNPADVEYIFLKDNVPQGTTWNSPNITGTQGGTSFTIFIKMTLFEKAITPTTSGIVTSSDVLKVRYEYFITIAPTTPFFTEERWFAKGIGLIYNSFNDGTNTDIYHIGRYQVF